MCNSFTAISEYTRYVDDVNFITRNLSLSLYGSTTLCWTLAVFFSFLILYTVGRTPWIGDQPVARPLPTYRTTQTETSMPRVGF
jgi:hypothetical protein